jgi:hypothetical protein
MEATVRHIFPQDKKPRNRYFYFAVVLMSLLIFTKCKDKPEAKEKKSSYKEEQVLAKYIDILSGQPKDSFCLRVIIDTFKVVRVDTIGDNLKQVREFVTDTFWGIPSGRYDTLRNEKGGIVYDKFDKPILNPQWQPHPKELIVKDYNYLRRYWLKDDTATIKK